MIDKVEKTVVQSIANMIICCCLFLSAGCEKKAQDFHFTVTGDMRDQHATYGRILQSINNIPEVDGEEVLDGIRQWVEIGTPTYEGARRGARAHAKNEQIYFSSLEPRAKMWIRLLETLE